MTLLGRLQTELGRIELHHDGEQFTTRRSYIDHMTCVKREPSIWHSRENAEEWYRLCELRGAVFADFPEPTPQSAAPERTTP
jgi:hypothetical protein